MALVAAAALVAGCAIEPPLHLRQALKVVVKVIWKAEIYPEGDKPTGVTLYIFRDGEFYKQQTTASVDSCMLSLEPGKYKLLMISQSPDEFGSVEFKDMTDFENASVSILETKSSWFTRASEDGEVLITNPENMVVGVSEEFEVSAELVEEFNEELARRRQEKATKADDTGKTPEEVEAYETLVSYYTIRVPVYPQSIVSLFWVSIYSENADLLKSVRCSTSGMAKSFMLTKGTTTDEEATQIITEWSLTIDDPVNRVGHLDGKVATFGFPNGEKPSPQRDSTLNVTTLLADYKTTDNYVFSVGDKITEEKPPDGYRSVYRLILGSVTEPVMHPPDVRPADEASGFDAVVSDWEEGESRDISM